MIQNDVIIACDFKSAEDTFRFLDLFKDEERKPFLKIGMELYYAEGPSIVREIKRRGHKIFLDLKLHDIPNTVRKAMSVLSRLDVDMCNVHAAGTIDMMRGALEGLTREDGTRPLLIAVTQLTSTSQERMENDLLIKEPLDEVVLHYANNAKIAGLEMCKFYKRQYGDDFISCMPTNLYGPYDNYDLNGSHVMPAMIQKFHEAKVSGVPAVELWGSGTPLREFLYVDDMADACVFLLENYSGEQHVNIGTGKEVTIKELAETVKKCVGFEGDIVWNSDMPDGTPRKLTNVDKLHELGWKHKVELEEGVRLAYNWFKENVEDARL